MTQSLILSSSRLKIYILAVYYVGHFYRLLLVVFSFIFSPLMTCFFQLLIQWSFKILKNEIHIYWSLLLKPFYGLFFFFLSFCLSVCMYVCVCVLLKVTCNTLADRWIDDPPTLERYNHQFRLFYQTRLFFCSYSTGQLETDLLPFHRPQKWLVILFTNPLIRLI